MAKKKNILQRTRANYRKGRNYVKSCIGIYKKYGKQNKRFSLFVAKVDKRYEKQISSLIIALGIILGICLFPLFMGIAILDVESK